MQRLFFIMQKEFRQILRDKYNLVIIFFMPFIQLILLSFSITTDVTNISAAIVDQDRSNMSRRMTEAFSVIKTFNFKGNVDSVEKAVHLMNEGRTKLIIVIPQHFERDLVNGRVPQVQSLIDGVDGNSAGIINGYLSRVMNLLQKEWLLNSRSIALSIRDLHTVELIPRMLYNPQLESKNNTVPGILAILLTMITLFLTTINIVKEKELGTLEQIAVTPVHNTEVIFGKILPFAICGFILFNVGLLVAGVVFGIWPAGNIFLLYLLCLIYMMTTLGVGIFLSTVSATQQQAIFFSWFFSIFAMLLSGFFVPVENMPPFIQTITFLNPTRYFMQVVRGIILKGSGISALWPELAALCLFGVVILTGAILNFHKRTK